MMEHPSLRVLLVDDDALAADLLGEYLRLKGHAVTVAYGLAEALGAAAAGEIDVVVSDIELPDGSGLELMHRLRARRDLPGIALSGHAGEDDARRSREAGFRAHVTKPVSFSRLEAALRDVARATPVGRGAGAQRASGMEREVESVR